MAFMVIIMRRASNIYHFIITIKIWCFRHIWAIKYKVARYIYGHYNVLEIDLLKRLIKKGINKQIGSR